MAVRGKFTVYGRSYCHLCDDMVAELKVLRSKYAFELEVIDIDADPQLAARYDQWVPVLTADGVELCHYHLDHDRVGEYLENLL